MEWLERHRSTLAASLLVLVAVAAFAVLQIPRRPALQVVSAVPPTPVPIKVHVVGAVSLPGVYQLPADSRIEDAMKAAGGPSESADVASLNLATPLRDGQQVAIPGKDTPPSPSGGSSSPAPPAASASPRPAAMSTPVGPAGKTNLNTATRQELEALPGIGVVLAGRILEYRTAHGGFTSIEELKDSKLLNSSTYEKVKNLVDVN